MASFGGGEVRIAFVPFVEVQEEAKKTSGIRRKRRSAPGLTPGGELSSDKFGDFGCNFRHRLLGSAQAGSGG